MKIGIGDLVRVKWSRRISQMGTDNIRKVWAHSNTPLLIVDMALDNLTATVIAAGRSEKIYVAHLTTRLW
jgi:hypothetical protein